MAFIVCEECFDSIGDKRCIDCHKLFCVDCKLKHLSLGQFPSHIFHNVEPVLVKKKNRGINFNNKNFNNNSKMDNFGIENIPHYYGSDPTDPENIPQTPESETKRKDSKDAKENQEGSKQNLSEIHSNLHENKEVPHDGDQSNAKPNGNTTETTGVTLKTSAVKQNKTKPSNSEFSNNTNQNKANEGTTTVKENQQANYNTVDKDLESSTNSKAVQNTTETMRDAKTASSEQSKPETNTSYRSDGQNKPQTNIGSIPDGRIKSQTSTGSIPDVVSDAAKDKRIFELTEPERDSVSSHELQDIKPKGSNSPIIDGEYRKYRLKSEKTAYSILEVTSICKEHDENYIFICDRCDVPVCKMCVVREHKGHLLSDIEEIATIRENALANVLTPRIAGAEKNSTEMEQHLQSFEKDIAEVNNAIVEHGERLKQMIDRQVNFMITNIKQKADRKKSKFQEVHNSLNEAVEKGKVLQKHYEELTKSNNDGALILKLKKLAKDTNSFHYPSVPHFPTVKYHPPRVTDGDIESLFGSFNFIALDPRTHRLPKLMPPPNFALDPGTHKLPKLMPPPNLYSTPKYRWQCCRCGTDQINDTYRCDEQNKLQPNRIYNNNLFFDCAKCRRSMYHLYRGKVYE